METTQITENQYVFTTDALNEAAEQGAIESEYMAQICRQQATEALTGALDGVRSTITTTIGNMATAARLEVRMAVFDTLHGTNYRKIRHDLIEKRCRETFEASIGLVAVGKK